MRLDTGTSLWRERQPQASDSIWVTNKFTATHTLVKRGVEAIFYLTLLVYGVVDGAAEHEGGT